MGPVSRIGARNLAALLPDVRNQNGAVYLALADAITALILDGRVATRVRLPSERELAAELGLSRATVTSAYDALRGTGFLTSRTGSGSFVTVPATAKARPSIARWSVSEPDDDVIDLSCGALPAPVGSVIEAAVTAGAQRLRDYLGGDGYDPAGLDPLRAAVAARFTARGVPTGPDQIMITNGALHGVDLLFRLLLGPGDRVLTELPTYPGGLDAIRAHGGRVVPVPMAATGGWQVQEMITTMRQTAPRLAYLIPDFHNPTGALVEPDERAAVLAAARTSGTTVVVDESFVDLGFCAGHPPTAAQDPNVITVGSISKPVWGGLRVGWIRCGAELVSRLAALRASIDMGGAVLDQLVAAELMGSIDAIAAQRAAELLPRRDALLAALARDLPAWQPTVPRGGISMWIELDAPLSTPLTLLAAQAGVIVVPGSRFGVDGTLERFLRVPFALPEAELDEAVRRLAAVWSGMERPASTGRALIVA
jgi:DNA-binding transcriptional MocR family regulator